MKKYNLSNIMKRAWELVKKSAMTISSGLKKAWEEAKTMEQKLVERFRPLSGSYISQYHPRNPMFCLGQIGGLRGKSNFIEMQPFWKVKNSHKSSI